MKRILIAVVALLAAGGLVFATGNAEKPKEPTASIVSLVDGSARMTIADLDVALGTPKAPQGAKFAYVTRTLNEYWIYETEGYKAEAKQLGVDAQVYDVINESSITEQLDKAKGVVTQGCSALLASPISATALDSVFKTVLDKGIPAIILNDARGSVPGVVYVGPDAMSIGAMAAEYIAKNLPGGGKVAMVEGDPVLECKKPWSGIQEGAGEASQPESGCLADCHVGHQSGESIASAMLTANPDIKAFYVHADIMTFGVEAAIAAKGLTGKIMLVSTDGVPQAKKDITEGKMTATISERPNAEGQAGVKAALWLLEGKKLPGWVDVPAVLIDKSNVDQYMGGMP